MAKISNKMKIKNADGTFEDIQISYIGPNYTWAEGLNTTASGAYSHAEGSDTIASETYSHAESQSTIASGRGSHSEGYRTIAIGDYSHVEGYGASFSIKVTGDANAKTYTLDRTYTNIKIGQSIVYKLDEGKMKIVSCTITSYDESVPSITLNKTLSEVALDKATVTVYKGGVSSGSRSHAEGDQTTASGNHSHAEGSETIASGEASHAEGKYTAALGKNSHAEGYGGNPLPSIINMNSSIDDIINLWKTDSFLLAFGKGSHAEGHATLASNLASHAEGTGTISSGAHSHAEGRETIASGDHQHVQGKFNIEDTSNTYAHIVGNGTSENDRSNAHTLDWNGNAWFAGNLSLGDSAMADFVVEQGTIGICQFRKWNSGVMEVWGRWSGTRSHYTTVSPFYGYYGTLTLPTELHFTTAPELKYNVTVGNGFAMAASTIMGNTATSVNWYALATNSGEQTCTVSFMMHGWWK